VRAQDGTVLVLGDVTDQREHLALLVDRDAAELPGRPVEPANGGPLETAHHCDLRGFQPLRARESRQHGDRLITWVAHHHVGDDTMQGT